MEYIETEKRKNQARAESAYYKTHMTTAVPGIISQTTSQNMLQC